MRYYPALRKPTGEVEVIDESTWKLLDTVKEVAVNEVVIRALRGDELRDYDLIVVNADDLDETVSTFDTTLAEWEDA